MDTRNGGLRIGLRCFVAVLAGPLAACGSLQDIGSADVPVATTHFSSEADGSFRFSDGKERASARGCFYRNPGTGEMAGFFDTTESGGLDQLNTMFGLQAQLEVARAQERRAVASELITALQAFAVGATTGRLPVRPQGPPVPAPDGGEVTDLPPGSFPTFGARDMLPREVAKPARTVPINPCTSPAQ